MMVNVVKKVVVKEDLGVSLLENLCDDMVIDKDGDSCYDGNTFYSELEEKEKALLLLEVVRQFKDAVREEIIWLGYRDMIEEDSDSSSDSEVKSVW